MSPISKFGVLAFAAAVLAVPSAHEHHRHLHARQALASSATTGVGATAVTSGSPSGATATGGVSTSDNTTTVGGGYSSGGFSGKRGVIYNDPANAGPFSGSSNFGWAANWVSSSGGLNGGFSYIPTLHNGDSEFTSSWSSDAQSAISSGATYLFGFNEPDIPSQANMSPEAAAAAWKQYMEPFAGKVKLVAPAVSNSASAGEGLDWLKSFMAACSGCTIDAVNQHWYDTSSNDISYFQSQVTAAHSQTGLPVFVGEFGFIGSDEEISQSISQAMNWMDSNPAVVGYAYFMASVGLLNDGPSSLSSYGQTYLSG